MKWINRLSLYTLSYKANPHFHGWLAMIGNEKKGFRQVGISFYLFTKGGENHNKQALHTHKKPSQKPILNSDLT